MLMIQRYVHRDLLTCPPCRSNRSRKEMSRYRRLSYGRYKHHVEPLRHKMLLSCTNNLNSRTLYISGNSFNPRTLHNSRTLCNLRTLHNSKNDFNPEDHDTPDLFTYSSFVEDDTAYLNSLPKHIQEALQQNHPGLQQSFVNYLRTYSASLKKGRESKMLVNPTAAKRIARTVIRHSSHLRSTSQKEKHFYDAEGGLCLLSVEMRKQLDKLGIDANITVIEKDRKLVPLHSTFDLKNLKIGVHDKFFSLTTCIHQALLRKPSYLHSVLYEQDLNSWEDSVPALTLVSTAPHSFLKYLSNEYLNRSYPETFSLLYGVRPEFFLIVPPLFYFVMKNQAFTFKFQDDGSLITEATEEFPPFGNRIRKYFWFRFLFDVELVDLLSVYDFMPCVPQYWHGKVSKQWQRRVGQEKLEDFLTRYGSSLVMLKVVPKVDPGLDLQFLSHFGRKMSTLHRTVVPMLERSVPGSGLDFLGHGYSMYSRWKDLSDDEIRFVFNMMMNNPNFKYSTFEVESQLTMKQKRLSLYEGILGEINLHDEEVQDEDEDEDGEEDGDENEDEDEDEDEESDHPGDEGGRN